MRRPITLSLCVPLLLLGAGACGPPSASGADTSAGSGSGSSGPTSASSSDTVGDETTSADLTSAEWQSGWDDMANDPTYVPCDVFAQDCFEGEKCSPWASQGVSWDGYGCVPVLGTGAAGEPCSYDGPFVATDDCDADSHCWSLDAENAGTCTPFCQGSADAPTCPETMTCSVSSTLAICQQPCDPVAQGCPEGQGCYWTGGDFICVQSSLDILVGEPCESINDCEAGLFCIAAEALPSCDGASCCASYCLLNEGDAPCEAQTPGTVCVPFFEPGEAPPEYEQIGLCISPP